MPAQVWAQRDADGGDEAERRAAFLEICSAETRFRAWYERALPRVYGFVFGRTGGDATVADEITQHAFVAAIRHHATFDGRSDPVVWVCSIARNALIDHHRRRARDARRHLSLMEARFPSTAMRRSGSDSTIETRSWACSRH